MKKLVLLILISGCLKDTNNNILKTKFINSEIHYIKNVGKNKYQEIVFDSLQRLLALKTMLNNNRTDIIYFTDSGTIDSKLMFNDKGQLDGKCYYFYPSNILKSIITYKSGIKIGVGEEFYERSGILKTRYYYDVQGTYYFAEVFSDSTKDKNITFNPNNPNSYNLIKKNIDGEDKEFLLKQMIKIGLDSLKQIH